MSYDRQRVGCIHVAPWSHHASRRTFLAWREESARERSALEDGRRSKAQQTIPQQNPVSVPQQHFVNCCGANTRVPLSSQTIVWGYSPVRPKLKLMIKLAVTSHRNVQRLQSIISMIFFGSSSVQKLGILVNTYDQPADSSMKQSRWRFRSSSSDKLRYQRLKGFPGSWLTPTTESGKQHR